MPGIESIDKKQVKKAVAALLKYIGKQKNERSNLLEEDELLYLVSVQLCRHAWPSVVAYASFLFQTQFLLLLVSQYI